MSTFTTIDRTTSNGSTRAGEMPLLRHLTEIHIDGQHVDTIIWNGPLLARLERKGMTREQHVALIINRHHH